MVLLEVTGSLRRLLEENGVEVPDVAYVEHGDLIRRAKGKIDVDRMMQCTRIYYMPREPVYKRPAELDRRLAAIRKQQELREYSEMSHRRSMDTGTPRDNSKAERKEIAAILNVLLSVLGVGYGVFTVGHVLPDVYRVLLAFFAAVAVGAVESLLYVIYMKKKGEKRRSKGDAMKKRKGPGVGVGVRGFDGHKGHKEDEFKSV